MKGANKFFIISAALLSVIPFVSSLWANQEGAIHPSKAEVFQKAQKLHIPFVANKGQTDERVEYYANTFHGTVFVTKYGEIIYSLPEVKEKAEDKKNIDNLSTNEADYFQGILNSIFPSLQKKWNLVGINSFLVSSVGGSLVQKAGSTETFHGNIQDSLKTFSGFGVGVVVLKEEIVNGKTDKVKGEGKAVTQVNYFKGNDPSHWKTNIPTYEVANFGEIYDGIDLKLKAYGNNVEKLFYVKPNANPDVIKIKLHGADSVRVNEAGQLEVDTELGTVKFTKPVAYQEINGKRVDVAAEYDLLNQKSEYGFRVASYDKTTELIIDPLLASTFLGGLSNEWNEWLDIDSNGNIYVTGFTVSPDFPTTAGAYDTSRTRLDGFVSKLSSDLTSLIASTFLGGSSNDYSNTIVVDSHGDIYVAGDTISSDFPTTPGAYDVSYNGGPVTGDHFVSKLSSDLSVLLASTYVGGSADDKPVTMAIDANENVFIMGRTDSTDYPITVGAYDNSYNGGGDTCLSLLSSDLTSLIASTFLGGNGFEWGYSIAFDSSGNVCAAGYTRSSNFPTTLGAYRTSHNGGYDAFVSKLSGDLTNLVASTYLGHFSNDYGYSNGIDSDGNVYVAGFTYSPGYPTTTGAYDTSYNGNGDAFVSKFSADLTSLIASTFLGGTNGENAYSMAIASNGDVYITGRTNSSDFPTTTGAYDMLHNGNYDIFVSRLDGALTNLTASSYLGGSLNDFGRLIVLNSSGNVYVTGRTFSSDFPATTGAYDTSFNGGDYDAFVSKFDSNLSSDVTPPTVISTSPVDNATDVDINSTITATFSETMDVSTITDATFIVNGVTGIVTCDGTTATFAPSSPLVYSTVYTAIITTGVKDIDGNAMAADYTWSFTTAADELAVGLQALYVFEEGTGTIASDSSGNGQNGTINGGAIWTTGKNGGGLSFDGIDDYVSIPCINNDEISICAWFYKNANDTTNADAIFGGLGWNANIQLREGFDLRFHQSTPDTIEFRLVTKDGSGSRTSQKASYRFTNSNFTWYHVVGTYNKATGEQKLYVDGQLANTQIHPAGNTVVPLTYYPDMRIGYSRVNNGYFNGSLDDVCLYNRALSDQEVQNLYNK